MTRLQRDRLLRARTRNRVDGCARDRKRGDARHPGDHCRLANRVSVTAGVAPLRRVDDEVDPSASNEALIAAMILDPALVNRPIVSTPKGAALCRPAELALTLL